MTTIFITQITHNANITIASIIINNRPTNSRRINTNSKRITLCAYRHSLCTGRSNNNIIAVINHQPREIICNIICRTRSFLFAAPNNVAAGLYQCACCRIKVKLILLNNIDYRNGCISNISCICCANIIRCGRNCGRNSINRQGWIEQTPKCLCHTHAAPTNSSSGVSEGLNLQVIIFIVNKICA